MRGPAAPKDPVEKRPCLYVVLDKTISGSGGRNSRLCVLRGKIKRSGKIYIRRY